MTRHLFLQGDARVGLQIVPPGSVHCCVTSPPYFNQRDYRADGQIGQEETPADYVAALVEVCRGVWQALRDDGCFYLNVGDSHARKTYDDPLYGRITEGNLIGIPWMLAFALRREGFCLRMDNIWAKTNPKPSSVKNCTTPSHEYIFHLTKVPTGYYYDREAILEPLKRPEAAGALFGGKKYPGKVPNATYSGNAYVPSALGGRNKWSVWTMPTANYAGSHTAVFPEALVRTCILAGTSAAGCCPACGAPYRRITEVGEPDLAWQQACGGGKDGGYRGKGKKDYAAAKAEDASAIKARILKSLCRKTTVRWEPTCTCNSGEAPVPATVLDPFHGSGTTTLVARELGRNSIGIELNPASIQEARERLGIAAQAVLDTGAVEYEFLVVE
jgi:DNA modification methylase